MYNTYLSYICIYFGMSVWLFVKVLMYPNMVYFLAIKFVCHLFQAGDKHTHTHTHIQYSASALPLSLSSLVTHAFYVILIVEK